MGLWYQIMSPLRVWNGPVQFKKYWPKPVINTGKVPATKINENDLLFDFELRSGWDAQKTQMRGIQLAKPINDNLVSQIESYLLVKK